MRHLICFCALIGLGVLAHSQEDNIWGLDTCNVLNYIPDTTNLDDVYVRYVNRSGRVDIEYGNANVSKTLPSWCSFECTDKYIPSIPTMEWKNEEFVGLTMGCGTYCFATILAPLRAEDTAQIADGYLIDTNQTLFMNLYWDTVTFKPMMEVMNYHTGKRLEIKLKSKVFWGAILEERLDYSPPHSDGFLFREKILTLYLDTDKKKYQSIEFDLTEL
ncbi:hypothetical protein KFE98_04950 [bacterium SCSIO 12741]|nr:hypothetical protein KFE98_04950 [bacterium SCSIO 12741]